jgi:hypothetical protein
MEDIISLTPKQLSGLVYHLNEELYRQSVHEQSGWRRIITVPLLNGCVNCYNNPTIPDSSEEREKDQHELELVHGLKWSDKDYAKAFKDG